MRHGAGVKRGDASINAVPAVIFAVQKQPGANTVALTVAVERALAELKRGLPADVTADHILFRQADFIERVVDNVMEALRDGAILVTLVLFAFLMNMRTTVISLTAIPLSIVATALVFQWMGLSINTMTLGGLAVAIGELVDDAVVDVENILRRLRENARLEAPRPVIEVIRAASSEVRNSIVYATLIVVLVFLPLFALSGIEGPAVHAARHRLRGVPSWPRCWLSLTVTPALSYLPAAKGEGHCPWGRLAGAHAEKTRRRSAALVVRSSCRRDRSHGDAGRGGSRFGAVPWAGFSPHLQRGHGDGESHAAARRHLAVGIQSHRHHRRDAVAGGARGALHRAADGARRTRRTRRGRPFHRDRRRPETFGP